jgi:hypothetical protein
MQAVAKLSRSHSVNSSLYFLFSQDISIRLEQPVQPLQNKHDNMLGSGLLNWGGGGGERGGLLNAKLTSLVVV